MRLCSGSLLNSAVVEEPTTEVQALASRPNQESIFLWYQYPPSTIPSDANATAVLTNRDLEEAYKGLDLLDKLVPPPMNVLLVKGMLQLSGDLLSYSRLDHSRAGGTSWMANNELEMKRVYRHLCMMEEINLPGVQSLNRRRWRLEEGSGQEQTFHSGEGLGSRRLRQRDKLRQLDVRHAGDRRTTRPRP
jgi:hypothetical protein